MDNTEILLTRKETNHIPVTTSPLIVSNVHLFQNLLKMSKLDANLVGDFPLASIPPLCELESSGGNTEISKSTSEIVERVRETQKIIIQQEKCRLEYTQIRTLNHHSKKNDIVLTL